MLRHHRAFCVNNIIIIIINTLKVSMCVSYCVDIFDDTTMRGLVYFTGRSVRVPSLLPVSDQRPLWPRQECVRRSPGRGRSDTP